MRYAARAVIVENGKLLVIERQRVAKDGMKLHYLSIPGGQVEEDEQPEQTVVRELKEEMSIDIEVKQLVAHVYMTASEWYQSQEHMMYVCERSDRSQELTFNAESPEAKLKDEVYKVVWRSLSELDIEPKLHGIYQPVMKALLPYLQKDELPTTPIDIDVPNLL